MNDRVLKCSFNYNGIAKNINLSLLLHKEPSYECIVNSICSIYSDAVRLGEDIDEVVPFLKLTHCFQHKQYDKCKQIIRSFAHLSLLVLEFVSVNDDTLISKCISVIYRYINLCWYKD